MNKNQIVITGLGAMTGLGLNCDDTWKGLLEGRCPVKRFTLFDPEGLSSPFGVELPGGEQELFKKNIKPRSRRQMTRSTKMAIVTAGMAIGDAAVDLDSVDRNRVGVVVGATGTGYAPRALETDRNRILRNMASAASAWLSLKWKLKGPAFTVSTACSSGAYALYSAMQLIYSGQCDVVITGACDSVLNYLDIEGFCSLMALSDDVEHLETASRPFDKKRNGFVMGEGSGFLVLESIDHALKRDARKYASVSLPGLSSDAYNIMSPRPKGEGMAGAMRLALDNAGLNPDDIDYINAHGTSTYRNDLYETEAIKKVFGKQAYKIPVSSTKSMTGHCLSAAAGVESVIACKALTENQIPPTMNLRDPDPELDLDYVPLKPVEKELRRVMSNSFAFGGHNGVIVFSKI